MNIHLIITLFSVSFISLIDCLWIFFYLDAFLILLISHILLLNFDHLSTLDFHCYFRFLILVLSLLMLLLHIYFMFKHFLILKLMESTPGLGLFRNRMSNCFLLIFLFLTCFFLVSYSCKIYLLLLLRLHLYLISNETYCFNTNSFLSPYNLFLFILVHFIAKVLIYFLQRIKLLLIR